MMKFRKTILKLFLVLTIILTVLITPTFAEVFGGRWIVNPSYYMTPVSRYYTPLVEAVSVWNTNLAKTGTTIRIRSNSQSAATVTPVEALYGYVGWAASCSPLPNRFSGVYSYAEFRINTSYMWEYTPTKLKAILSHELGHLLGIDHTVSTTTKSIMYGGGAQLFYDQWLLTGPTSYDYNSLNSIY